MQTDATPYSQLIIDSKLATHRQVKLQLTSRQLPESQVTKLTYCSAHISQTRN